MTTSVRQGMTTRCDSEPLSGGAWGMNITDFWSSTGTRIGTRAHGACITCACAVARIPVALAFRAHSKIYSHGLGPQSGCNGQLLLMGGWGEWLGQLSGTSRQTRLIGSITRLPNNRSEDSLHSACPHSPNGLQPMTTL